MCTQNLAWETANRERYGHHKVSVRRARKPAKRHGGNAPAKA